MGSLALAGAVSGMGQGLERGLTQLQGGIIQQGLMESSQKFQSEKLKEQMAHAERLHALTEASAERRLATTEGGAQKRLETSEAGAERRQGKQIKSHEKLAGEEIISKEKLSKDSLSVHKEMNAATNQMHRDVAKWELSWKKAHTEKTDLAAKIAGVSATLRDTSDEITRLNTVVSNPLADKADPNYKAAVEILTRATKLHDAFVQYQAQLTGMSEHLQGDVQSAMPNKTPAAFKFPPGMAPQSSVSTGTTESMRARGPRGLIETPIPSDAEQEMMQRSLGQ